MRSKQYFTSIENNPHENSTEPKKGAFFNTPFLFTLQKNLAISYALLLAVSSLYYKGRTCGK